MRKKILEYYQKKYQGSRFLLDIIEDKSTEELEKAYKKDLIRDKKENSIIKNGTTTFTIDFDYKVRKEVEKFMWDNNMFTLFNGEIKYRNSSDGRLLGVPIEFIEELKKKFELKLSREVRILGKNELKNFKVGDKVTITIGDMFGGQINKQGTVYEVSEDEIIVRAYRSKTKGYTLTAGGEYSIRKINKFKTVS